MDFTDDKYILLPVGSYSFGVEAHGRGRPNVELHGAFSRYRDAAKYKDALLEEYSDYHYAIVVKIETVEPSYRDKHIPETGVGG